MSYNKITSSDIQNTDKGPIRITTIIETLNYDSLECFEFPKNCINCPIGYSKHDCGRNIPFKDEDYNCRPNTCKLKLIK